MKRAGLAGAVSVMVCGILIPAIAVSGVDFSGTWIFQDQGRPPNPGNLTIVQRDNTITITGTVGQPPSTLVYILDGAEHLLVDPRGGSFRYKAVLNGNSIHITGTRNDSDPSRMQRQMDQTFILSADGMTLTLSTRPWGPNGFDSTRIRNMVFKRK